MCFTYKLPCQLLAFGTIPQPHLTDCRQQRASSQGAHPLLALPLQEPLPSSHHHQLAFPFLILPTPLALAFLAVLYFSTWHFYCKSLYV